jgi:hypothetical protein
LTRRAGWRARQVGDPTHRRYETELPSFELIATETRLVVVNRSSKFSPGAFPRSRFRSVATGMLFLEQSVGDPLEKFLEIRIRPCLRPWDSRSDHRAALADSMKKKDNGSSPWDRRGLTNRRPAGGCCKTCSSPCFF